MVWKNDPYQNFVILEYKIKNTTADPLTNFYMGIFADWDILAGGGSDKAAWDNDTRLGYVFPAQPSAMPRVGIQALSGTPNYYAIDNDHTISGNPLGLYDGFTDAEKFAVISGGLSKIQAGGASGSDVSQVVSVGPYTINSGEEITLAFALHGGNSLPDLITSAKYADSLYNFTFKAPRPIAEAVETCNGDNAVLEVTGGTKFNWYTEQLGGDPVFSGPEFTIPNLGKDTVVYVSNADKSYESLRTAVSVSIMSPPVIIPSGPLEFCEGLTVTLSVEDEGYNYIWNNGTEGTDIEITSAGSYTATVQTGGLECVSLPVEVTVHPNPVAAFITTTQEISAGSEVDFYNDSKGATSWLWDFGDGSTSMEENPVHIYTAAGNYLVTLTAISNEGCQATDSRSVGLITGTETSLENDIRLYPNPVSDDINISIRTTHSEPFQVKVFNSQGALVYDMRLDAGRAEALINASGFAKGIYLVNVSSETETFTKRIVVIR
jgi:PKD repeat protein